MTSSFSLYVIINTARQKKTSKQPDGNTTGNQETSSHNDKITPHNYVATVHYDKTPKRQDKKLQDQKKHKAS